MTNNLPVRVAPFAGVLERRTSRALGRLDAEASLVRRADALRADRVAQVTEHAQLAVAQLSATESMLIQAVPLAEPRLKMIGDAATMALSDIVMRAGRE